MPIVSVIVPSFNDNAEFFAMSLESILKQTFVDFELLIINEHGASRETIDQYAKKDSRIKVIQNQEVLGLSASLNVGLELAQGEFIARMDADDISLPMRFEKQVYYMRENQDVDICGSNIRHIDDSGEYTKFGSSNYPLYDELIKAYLLFTCPIAHPSVMMRASTVRNLLISYDETFLAFEDLELWTRIAHRVKFHNIYEPLLLYRVHAGSASCKPFDKFLFIKIMRRGFLEIGLDLKNVELELLFSYTRCILESVKSEQLLMITTCQKNINKANTAGIYGQRELEMATDRFLGWAKGRVRHRAVSRLRASNIKNRDTLADILEQTIFLKSIGEYCKRHLIRIFR